MKYKTMSLSKKCKINNELEVINEKTSTKILSPSSKNNSCNYNAGRTHPGAILYLDAIFRKENRNFQEPQVEKKVSYFSKESELFAIRAFLKEWDTAVQNINKSSINCRNEDILNYFSIKLTINDIENLDLDPKLDSEAFKDRFMQLLFDNQQNIIKTKWAARKRKDPKANEYSFKPKISKKSEKLASNKGKVKERLLSPKRITTTIKTDESQELILPFSPRSKNIDPIEKSRTLFEDAMKKALKFDKCTEEVEWEKNQRECTFSPKIYLRSPQNSTTKGSDFSPVYTYSKSESKYFERMKEARVSKHVSSELRAKGITPSEKVIRRLKAMAEENEPLIKISLHENLSQNALIDRQPILAVDVNIDEEKCDKLVIYENDDPYQLACEFATRHSLNEEMKEKLITLLKVQMNSLLCKIDEEDEN